MLDLEGGERYAGSEGTESTSDHAVQPEAPVAPEQADDAAESRIPLPISRPDCNYHRPIITHRNAIRGARDPARLLGLFYAAGQLEPYGVLPDGTFTYSVKDGAAPVVIVRFGA